jgi:flagellar motor switch protein FliM
MAVDRDIAEGGVKAFNFSRAGLLANDQLRTLRTLDEQFARNLTHTLGAWLRTNIAISPQPAEQSVFSQFMEKAAMGRHVVPLRLEPLQVRGAMSLDLQLAPAIIDLLLGGSGRVGAFSRDLTEIEEAVLGSVLDIVLREWSSAWTPFGLEFIAGTRSRDSHGQRLMPLQERTFCSRFQVTLADLTGELVFCLPSSSLISTLKAVSHRRDRQRQRTVEEHARMMHRLGGAGLQAQLHFPSMRLSAKDLRELQPGSLLPLPLPRGVSGELRVGGVAVFRAQPVRAGEHRAAQIVHAMESISTDGETV